MPNVVKYSTTSENNAIKKGNIAIGVNSVDYGGGGQSGWWNTIDVPTGGYVVYANKASNGPSIMVPPDDTALVGVARSFGASSSVTTAAGALNYFASQSDMMVVNKNYNNIVTSGLVLNVDASFVASYPVSGTSWYDISGSGNTGTLVNGPTFNTNGWINFDGTNDQVNIPNNSTLQITRDQTLEFIVYPERRDRRQNWYNKSYGGEGTITYETGGTMNYFWGTAGSNNQPYQGVGSGSELATLNRWYHVVLVRELSTPTKTVKWYINGSLNRTVTASYTAATASSSQITLGNGYTNPFLGRLPVTRQYNIALSSSQVLQNYYGGPIVTSGLTFAVDAGNLVSFQNGSGSTFSLVGSYTGTLTNGVSYTTGGGGSWDLDGSDDWISIATYTFGNGGWTCNVWVQGDSVTYSTTGNIISNSSGGPVTNAMGFVSSKIHYRNYDGAWKSNSGNTTLTAGQWYMLTWVNYSGATAQQGTMKMFVNGNVDSSVFNSYTTNGGPCDAIGRNWFSYFNGRIGLVQFYNKSLTDVEVTQNFNAHRNRFGL
jgi:hypothetical protein